MSIYIWKDWNERREEKHQQQWHEIAGFFPGNAEYYSDSIRWETQKYQILISIHSELNDEDSSSEHQNNLKICVLQV